MESTNSRSRLRELHGSGYEISDGQPNIIGWEIKDRNNHRIGVVDDLLFDEDLQKVRYIIANLKDNHFDLDRRKVLIPIGIAQLHDTDDDVIVPNVSAWQLRALPTYNNRITDYDEHEIYTVFSTPLSASSSVERDWQKPQNFYEHSTYDQNNMFNSRRTGTQPAEHTFRRRANADSNYKPSDRSTSDDYSTSRSLHETDALAAGHHQRDSMDSDDMNRKGSASNDRLLSKINRVRSELDEIERDLRNTRGL
jgi:hypothetical protein